MHYLIFRILGTCTATIAPDFTASSFRENLYPFLFSSCFTGFLYSFLNDAFRSPFSPPICHDCSYLASFPTFSHRSYRANFPVRAFHYIDGFRLIQMPGFTSWRYCCKDIALSQNANVAGIISYHISPGGDSRFFHSRAGIDMPCALFSSSGLPDSRRNMLSLQRIGGTMLLLTFLWYLRDWRI